MFSCTWIENNLFSLLRENGYSQEWIELNTVETLFSKFFSLREKILIKNSQEWFYSVLSEIESKSKQTKDSNDIKEPIAILHDQIILERQYFGDTIKNILKEINTNEK